jgi:hypothetical protein
MATLREMLVKIYQPKQGIIEFGPGGSTQDGATDLAVLGGTPGQESGSQQGGGTIGIPSFRYAGADGGGGDGGGGGIDWSNIDWNDPGQVEAVRRQLAGAGREGGQGGEPGGAGAGGIEPGEDGYVNLDSSFGDLLDIVKALGPFPIGLIGSLTEAGIRGTNVGRLDDQLEGAGFESGLSGLQQVGATLGLNDYGEGSWGGNLAGSAAAQRSSYAGEQGFNSLSGAGGSYRTSPAGPTQRTGGSFGGAFGGGGSAGERTNARGGFGGGGMSRQQEIFHDGGMVNGLPGEEVNGTLLAGEYVMSPEAVDMVGPDNLGRMNSLARMMRQQHYPAR